MKKTLFLQLSVAFTFSLFFTFNAQAQCDHDNAIYLTWSAPSTIGDSVSSFCSYGGDYNRVTNMIAGYTYQIYTCGDTHFDTQLTIYKTTDTTTSVAFNDDYCGLQSLIDFIPTTTGDYDIMLDMWDCADTAECMTMVVKLIGMPIAASNDVGVIAIDAPSYDCGLGATEDVTIRVKNFGDSALTDIPVSYRINNGSSINDTISATLNSGDTAIFTFSTTADLSSTGIYSFDSWTSLVGDDTTNNDSIINYSISTIVVTSFPYVEDFETFTVGSPGTFLNGWTNGIDDDFDWYVNTDSTYSGGTGPSGDNTTGSGNYLYTEASSPNYSYKRANIISPCFDISSLLSPKLSFWYHMYGFDMGNLYVDIYSSSNWTTLDSIVGEQQTSGIDSWLEKIIDVSSYSGSIRIRFRGLTGNGWEGDMAIDDISIYQPVQNDVGVVSITSPISGCNLDTSKTIKVKVTNYGSATQKNIPISYTLNGGIAVNETITDSITSGSTISYTFNKHLYLSSFGNYTIDVWTSLSTDSIYNNDSILNYQITNYNCESMVTFQKTYGGVNLDEVYIAQQTKDGGYFSVGNTESFGAGNNKVYLVKTDSSGTQRWSKVYGGTSDDYGYVATQTTDGGFCMSGTTISYGAGGWDVNLIKIDSLGDTLWAKTYGGIGDDWINSMEQTTDGGYILAGITNSFGASPSISSDYYVLKLDASGDTMWTKTYGSTSDESAQSIMQTSDGGYIVIGYTEGLGAGLNDIYVVKIDSLGNIVWSNTYGGTDEDYAFSGYQTIDGGYILAGYTFSFDADYDIYLVKINSNGNIEWSKTYGGSNYDYLNNLQITSDNGYIITGKTYSYGAGNGDVFLIKTDVNGNVQWGKTYGGKNEDYGQSVQQTNDGGYLISGVTKSFGAGDNDVYLIKTDAEGKVNGCYRDLKNIKVDSRTSISGTATTFVSAGAIVSDVVSSFISAATIENDANILSLSFTTQTATCNGICDGSAKVTASGGSMPYSYSWDAGTSNQTIQQAKTLCGGTYAVTISDVIGCLIADSITVKDSVPTISQSLSSNNATCNGICDGVAIASATGTYPPLSYSWSDTTQTSATAVGLCSGTYFVSITDTYGCITVVDSIIVKDSVPTITLSLSKTDVICNGTCDGTSAVSISGTYPPFSYLWNDISSQTTNTAVGLCADKYIVTATDTFGCISVSDSITIDIVPMDSVPICIITIDSTSTKNIVVWGHPMTVGIDSFRIYREVPGFGYKHTGSVANTELSEYVDESTGINPQIQSYKYKISVIDSCGNESAMSAYHKTMNLSVSKNTSDQPVLSWDNYEGFGFSYYRILRDTTGLWSNFEVIDSSTNSNTQYVDVNAPSKNVRYLVEVVHSSGCTAEKIKNYNTSRSNTAAIAGSSGNALVAAITTYTNASGNCDGTATVEVSGGAAPYTYQWDNISMQTDLTATGLCGGQTYTVTVTDSVGAEETATVDIQLNIGILSNLLSNNVNIYPNPNNGEFTLEYQSDKLELTNVIIYNMLGEVVYQTEIINKSTNIVSLKAQPQGIYHLQIISNSAVLNRQIVVE